MQPVVFGEVLEILQVQGGQWQVSDQAASGDPRVIDRAGATPPLRLDAELTPFPRHSLVVRQDDCATRSTAVRPRSNRSRCIVKRWMPTAPADGYASVPACRCRGDSAHSDGKQPTAFTCGRRSMAEPMS